MRIWVDADACPGVIRDILYRAVRRTSVPMTLVANSAVQHPPHPLIHCLKVAQGADVADQAILDRLHAGDLVITADIPLAAEVIAADALALNPRGERYTAETVRQRLNMRDFMETLRASGIHGGGQAPLDNRHKQAFANQLDRILTAHIQR